MNFEEPAATSRAKSDNALSGRRPSRQMQMVGGIVDGDQHLALTGDNAEMSLPFVVVRRSEQALPAFDGEHYLNPILGTGICHARKLPLPTELNNFLNSTETTRLPPPPCSSKRAVDLRHPAVPPASEPETAACKHNKAQLEINGIQLPAADDTIASL